jgi:hypothetical protein
MQIKRANPDGLVRACSKFRAMNKARFIVEVGAATRSGSLA